MYIIGSASQSHQIFAEFQFVVATDIIIPPLTSQRSVSCFRLCGPRAKHAGPVCVTLRKHPCEC